MREKLGLKLPGQRLEGKIFKQAYVIYTLVSYPRAQFWAFHYNSLANHCAGIQFLCWYHSPQSWRQMDNPTHNHPSLALGDLAYRHAPCKDEDLSETGPSEQNHCNPNKKHSFTPCLVLLLQAVWKLSFATNSAKGSSPSTWTVVSACLMHVFYYLQLLKQKRDDSPWVGLGIFPFLSLAWWVVCHWINRQARSWERSGFITGERK